MSKFDLNYSLGVAEIINRLDGLPFDEYDEQLFEVRTIALYQCHTTEIINTKMI